MTTTPVILVTKRSGNAADRPATTTIQAGEAALCFGASEPGFYFKDSASAIRKVGPTHYGATAPNSTPVGAAGNAVGELWVDSSATSYYLKIWNGSSWLKVGAGFADNAASANVTIASGAIVANSAIVASGALGAVLASGSLGAILASGSRGAILASGSLGAILASGSRGAILASGSLGAILASGSRGAILASGSLGAILASGVVTATGISCADIYSGTLTGTATSGALRYKYDNTGSPSGLYVAFAGGWALV
jgi:hypothetical protein